MILELEVSNPFQRKPGFYRSNVTIIRVWWLWFAVALLRRRGNTWEDK